MDPQPDNPQRHSLWPEVVTILIIAVTIVAVVAMCAGVI